MTSETSIEDIEWMLAYSDVDWTRRNTGVFVSPGEYLVTLKKGDKEFQQKALVQAMPEQE